jgi:hypothetical protein
MGRIGGYPLNPIAACRHSLRGRRIPGRYVISAKLTLRRDLGIFQQEPPFHASNFHSLCRSGAWPCRVGHDQPGRGRVNLIRWDGNGYCQVWDQGIPTKPFPSDYKTVSAPVPTLVEALAVKEHLLRKRVCAF